ncbi:MAG: type II secretion system protein GspL [Magnetococcus sp. YQC-5]
MKSAATWGLVPSPQKQLWVRLVDRNALVFETGMSVIVGGERAVLAGLSVVGMTLRKTVLPFTRRDQIWAILPQEAMDTLLYRLDDPCFALQWEPVEQGAAVFFAMCERSLLDELLARLTEEKIKPVGVVMAELGSWPLLEAAGLLGQQTASQQSSIVVDGSADPVAVYSVTEGQLRDLRLVAPATVALGEGALLEELGWLIQDLMHRLSGQNLTGVKMIFLGHSRVFWQPLWEVLGWTNVEVPGLEALGQGLRSWEWVRPAGLALAAAQGSHHRLMDFMNGAGDKQWQTWLRPWRGAALLVLMLLMIWGGQQAMRYHQAKSEYARLKTATEAIFREALPHIPVIVEPQLQLKQALGQANVAKEGSFQSLGTWIGIIQNSVPVDTQVKWLRLRYEPGEVQLTGEVPSYQHLDRVRAALQQVSGGKETRMDEARIVPETKIVRFRLGVL